MAKINILFDEKNYSIDEANLAPATDALKAHLETLGGGESGGLVEGETYTLKNNLNDIDPNDFMKTPETSEPLAGKGYAVAMFSETSMLAYLTSEGFDYLFRTEVEGVAPAGAWLALNENGYYAYLIKHANNNQEIIDNNVGWLSVVPGTPDGTPVDSVSITISNFDESYGGYSLDELAVFFDIPSAGGDLDITLDGAVYKVDSTKLEPATNSLIAHLETLKGGEGGGLVEGETYTLKNNLNDINPNDFMNFPLDNEFIEAYTIFRYDPNVAAGLGYLPQEALSMFVENSIADGWMLTNPDVSEIYIYPRKIASSDGTPIDNNVGWFKMQETEAVGVEVSVTIPSPYDASIGYSLEEIAVFFDIPSAGGVPEFGTDWKFKDVITPEDFDTVLSHYSDSAAEQELGVAFNESKNEGFHILKASHPDMGTLYMLLYLEEGTTAPPVSFYNTSLLTEAGKEQYPMETGWYYNDMTPLNATPTIPNMSEDVFVFYTDGTDDASFNPEYFAPLFDLGGGSGNGGDTKIVINGVEYLVDSTKLADAKSALATHLGELAKETLSAPFANIDTNTLNIYDDTELATSFDILVDGEVKASVTKEGV